MAETTFKDYLLATVIPPDKSEEFIKIFQEQSNLLTQGWIMESASIRKDGSVHLQFSPATKSAEVQKSQAERRWGKGFIETEEDPSV